MKLKLICCEVFMRHACLAAARSPHTIDLEFTRLNSHVDPDKLRTRIQERIDAAGTEYDAVLLGFGLCGNSTAGLRAGKTPLVIPRAHDCCTLFLGSRKKFLDYFGNNLSAQWSTDGYMERGGSDYLRQTDVGKQLGIDAGYGELVEKYGEENAAYIWGTLHPEKDYGELTFITIPGESDPKYYEAFKTQTGEKGGKLRTVEGDLRLIDNLLQGRWDREDFLTVPPGKAISPLYDHDSVICAE